MNTGKFKVFRKLLFVACSLLTLATLPANADLLIGISFPSQGGGDNDVVGFDSTDPGTIIYDHPIGPAGDNDTIQIDESLLTLPKLHLQDSHWFGNDYKIWSTTITFSTTCTWADIHYIPQNNSVTNFVFPAFWYSFDPANFEKSYFTDQTVPELSAPSRSRSVSAKGTPNSSAAPDSSTGILNLSLDQNTIKLDWPADRIGWILQTQTNPGINSQWFPILGSSLTNHLDLILDRANTSVFFRLIAP